MVYRTSGPRGVNKNDMALLGQSKDSWPSMAPLGNAELTKTQKLLESKSKKKNENKKQTQKWKWKQKRKQKQKSKWKKKQKLKIKIKMEMKAKL